MLTFDSESLPTTHSFGAFLKSPGKGMIPCPESYHAPFWSARVDEFNWTDETFPALRELLCDLFLPRQHVWNREIVLTENSPNPSSCKQVSRVVD
jgi:hypothetical protein